MGKEDIQTLGIELKQKRNERNLSLKEVENATSIRMIYLQAIEEGEFNKIISPVYAQGFIKQYASYLGVESENILREHPEAFTNQDKQEFSYGIGTLETRGNPGSNVKWIPNAFWIVAFVFVLIAAWYLAHFLEVV